MPSKRIRFHDWINRGWVQEWGQKEVCAELLECRLDCWMEQKWRDFGTDGGMNETCVNSQSTTTIPSNERTSARGYDWHIQFILLSVVVWFLRPIKCRSKFFRWHNASVNLWRVIFGDKKILLCKLVLRAYSWNLLIVLISLWARLKWSFREKWDCNNSRKWTKTIWLLLVLTHRYSIGLHLSAPVQLLVIVVVFSTLKPSGFILLSRNGREKRPNWSTTAGNLWRERMEGGKSPKDSGIFCKSRSRRRESRGESQAVSF